MTLSNENAPKHIFSCSHERRLSKLLRRANHHGAAVLGARDRVVEHAALMVGATGHTRPPQDDDIPELLILCALDCHHSDAALRRIAISALGVCLPFTEGEKFRFGPKPHTVGTA